MHRAIFVLWNAEFYMVLFSFITPQFESGAQSEVTMLRPDSPSSCLTACWHSRDVPLLGKGFSLTVFHTSRYPCRWAQGKLIMRLKQNRLALHSKRPRVRFVYLRGCVLRLHAACMCDWKATPNTRYRRKPALPRYARHFISQLWVSLPQLHQHRKEWAKSAIIIGHYSNKGVSLFKLVHENCTVSKSHEPEKC